MYLRAKYTKYKMAKTKFSIWRYIICEICKKNGSNRPFLASRVADTIFPPPIEGHHRQLDNQCKDPMDNNKDCRVGQLTKNTCNVCRCSTSVRYTWLGADRKFPYMTDLSSDHPKVSVITYKQHCSMLKFVAFLIKIDKKKRPRVNTQAQLG